VVGTVSLLQAMAGELVDVFVPALLFWLPWQALDAARDWIRARLTREEVDR